MELTKTGKLAIVIAVVAILAFGGRWAYMNGYIPGITKSESTVPKSANIEQNVDLDKSKVEQVSLPKSTITKLSVPPIKMEIMAWNSQMGQIFANGGALTTQGSIMEKHGVKVQIVRQDNVDKMKSDLVAFATALKSGNKNPTEGTHFVQIMGDGYAQFATSVNQQLGKLGSEYKVKLVGSAGRSLGEDKMMGPKEWLRNPQLAKGSTCAGYIPDGDWNIAMKWTGDNGVKNNPDYTTYNPNALNWINTEDFIDASNKYITGYTEERPVVDDKGIRTGAKQTISVNCVVTWTPGDEMIAKQKGGLVSILSTKENQAQMPNAIIGIDKWMQENREQTQELLQAIFEGSDQVKNYPEALDKAAELSAKVYGEQDAEYWKKYFIGSLEKDKQGNLIELGGSAVHNLKDNLNLFGLTSGRANEFEATYVVFGDIVVQQYPQQFPKYDLFSTVVDTSYLEALSSKYQVTTATIEDQQYSSTDKISQQTANKNVEITFESGSANLTSQGTQQLEALAKQLTISNAIIEVHGHTDNVGSPEQNQALSQKRAEAVKNYLTSKYPTTFPATRIRATGHGSSQSIADNNTAEGKAKNRRVQIVLGN